VRHLITISLCFFTIVSSAQSFKFQFYREQEGLNNRFIYTIDQDISGKLIIGTGEGLFQYDGLKFTSYSISDGLADNFITCSTSDEKGKIWFGHNNGSVSIWDRESILAINLESLTTARINDLFAANDSLVYALSQNEGLVKISLDGSTSLIKIDDPSYTYYSLFVDNKNQFWIGTDLGLLKCYMNENGVLISHLIEGLPYTKISSLHLSHDNKLLIGTEDGGAFSLDLKLHGATPLGISIEGIDLTTLSINDICEDDRNNLWISTNFHGLYQASNYTAGVYQKVIDYNEDNLIGTQSIQTCFKDRESNLWIGSKGKGLIKLVDDHFSVFKPTKRSNQTVYSISEMGETLVLGCNGFLDITSDNPNQVLKSYGPENKVPDGPINSTYCDNFGNIYVGSAEHGLWILRKGSDKLHNIALAEDKLNQKVNQIIGMGELVIVATDFGIYQLSEGKIISHLSIQSGLPHNVVRSLFLDSRGRIWIGTNSKNVSYIENGIIQSMALLNTDGALDIKCFAEDQAGNIWCGTNGMGTLSLSPEGIVSAYDKTKGLYSDYCYSIVCDQSGDIWVGHRGALSRIIVDINQIEVFHPSASGEVDFQDRSAIKLQSGNLLFGTDFGILKYDPQKEIRNSIEPVLNITEVLISDSSYALTDHIQLPSGVYKATFQFTGTSLRNPDGVTYQYFLEGYDLDWSTPSNTRSAIYNRLEPGNYTFRVKTFNSDGIGGSTIKEIKLTIKKPFWQQWWFVASCALAAFVIIRLIVKRRERFLKANQEYLQKELGKRTLEVVEQKELLEKKNRDITASINYAKNIQKAVLPEPGVFNKFFASSFVYHKPCDIVSGDFYWSEKSGNKILVACADCTGHGVPGAFMSLIGNTLLREVFRDALVRTPAQFLERLDKEMRSLLTKKEGSFSVEDGMDIALIEYDETTYKLKVASANRPIFIYTDGKLIECKGDRAPLGGSLHRIKSNFIETEYQLSPGDIIYLFSDGIVDQFGGPKGKKLKKTGLTSWIYEMAKKDLPEQRAYIRTNFNAWIGDHDQTDDVIIIGLQV